VWELALLGVPSLVVSLADNQAVLARTLGELGAAAWLGDARTTTDLATWAAQVDELMRDEARRSRLVQTARSLVDGKGALRVVDALWES
jgi:spore coat polysaccharide biosynthesis predicted glycosyltransferase SpsG